VDDLIVIGLEWMTGIYSIPGICDRTGAGFFFER
jgi:hypothetical protein